MENADWKYRESSFLNRPHQLNSLYLENKIFNHYLKCTKISRWRLPKSSKDKVELEPILSDFLPPINPSPIIFPIYDEDGDLLKHIRRVCGYREILRKREHIQFLREKETECHITFVKVDKFYNYEDEDIEDDIIGRLRIVAPGGGKEKKKKEKKSHRHKKKHYHKHSKSSKQHTKEHKKKVKKQEDGDDRQKSKREEDGVPVDIKTRSKRKQSFILRNYIKTASKSNPPQLAQTTKTSLSKPRRIAPQTQKPIENAPQEKDINNNPTGGNVDPKTILNDSNKMTVIKGKLESWIVNGQQNREKAPDTVIELDENANVINLEAKFSESTQIIFSPKRDKKHVVINLDNQLQDEIANEFRNRTQTVFAAKVKKTPSPTKKDKKKDKSDKPDKSKKGKHDKKGKGSKDKDGGKKEGKDKDKSAKKRKSEVKIGGDALGKKKSVAGGREAAQNAIQTMLEGGGGTAPVFDVTNFDAYYKFVFGHQMPEIPERDTEWLQLSPSDEEADNKELLQSFEKKRYPWMYEGVSFESQQLVKELEIFKWCCLVLGRQFYYTVPNFIKGQMEFVAKRIKMIPFFFSAFVLWASLVLICQSFITIRGEGSGDSSVLLEQLEMLKYSEPLLFVMSNLVLAAVWSVLVILRDGQLITHYLNCWCPALSEMETSGALNIKKITICNLIAWIVMSIILITCFWTERPGNVRGTAGIISMLMFRVIISDIRTTSDETYEAFQIFGLIFILYVLYCSRMLYTLMQIVSLVIRNTAEMWNFKFALTFQQLMLTNRGHLKRISLKIPLPKFFTHHRIMTALLKIYGDVFGVPIMIYMIAQIGVVTSVLVHLFNFKAGNKDDYNGTDSIQYEMYDEDIRQFRNLTIPYYHSPVEEVSTSVFVLGVTLFDFLFTTEIIALATQSFFDGFEFVRRTNLILCKNSHQRRLIQSLLWSMSDTDPSVVSASNFFAIAKPTVIAALGTAIFFFSLIIQLQSETLPVVIDFKSCTSAEARDELRCHVA